MKSLYIKDLQKGLLIENEIFAIFDTKKAQDKNGKTYYDLLIGDKTGKVKAKIWSDNLKEVDTNALKQGKLAQITGKVDEFKGVNQINILRLEGVDETKLEDFIESSEYDADEMMLELENEVSQIKHGAIRRVVENMLNDEAFVRKFKYWSAGKSIHHDFRSGMLQHILEMISISKGLSRFYPSINYDILLTGIIFHDIGKVEELDASGVGTTYTKKGTLLGHIFLGAKIFERYGGDRLPEDIYLHILHLILSHHGTHEWGSPVIPSTIEAVMLHYIDNLSAKPRTAHKAILEIPEGEEFGGYNQWLSNARMWKFNMPSEDSLDQSSQSVSTHDDTAKDDTLSKDNDQISLV